jgi:hypothetical protein
MNPGRPEIDDLLSFSPSRLDQMIEDSEEMLDILATVDGDSPEMERRLHAEWRDLMAYWERLIRAREVVGSVVR